MSQVVFVTFLYSLAALLLAWRYFRSYSIQRPPIGVFNLTDVAVMLGSILILPFLYVWLPTWLVGGLLGLSAISIIYFCLEPVIPSRPFLWSIVLVLCALDLFTLYWSGANSRVFVTFNNMVQVIVVVGISNLWAQSGMKARDCAILAGFLVGYDLLFTSALPLMNDLFSQLEGFPFAPLVAWSHSDGFSLAIGLGDLLLAATYPLILRKAYSLKAGRLGLFLAVGALATVFLLPALGQLQGTFPVMTLLGPLIVGQYLVWRFRYGVERTTFQYHQDEPRSLQVLAAKRPTLSAQRGENSDSS